MVRDLTSIHPFMTPNTDEKWSKECPLQFRVSARCYSFNHLLMCIYQSSVSSSSGFKRWHTYRVRLSIKNWLWRGILLFWIFEPNFSYYCSIKGLMWKAARIGMWKYPQSSAILLFEPEILGFSDSNKNRSLLPFAGERKSQYVAIACIAMGLYKFFA